MRKHRTSQLNNTNKETIFVFYNSPSGIKFKLENKIVEINGAPLSELYSPTGTKLTQGKFGISEILLEDWEEIVRLYASMQIFTSSLIFAHKDKNYAKDKAKEQENQVNGNEQVEISQSHSMASNE